MAQNAIAGPSRLGPNTAEPRHSQARYRVKSGGLVESARRRHAAGEMD
jgi:hypothetical protein